MKQRLERFGEDTLLKAVEKSTKAQKHFHQRQWMRNFDKLRAYQREKGCDVNDMGSVM